MSVQPKNTWYCSKCDFYVFNSKTECAKCSTQKPTPELTTSYDQEFDKNVCSYFQQERLSAETNCSKCKSEGRKFNNEPLLSNHNCWKYS